MEERYIRNLGALTEAECALLREKTVLVAGCGGLGGYLIEMLLRLGLGEIRAADGDCFEASNLNRQLLSAPGLLGKSKAEAAAERAALVNPEVRFVAVPEFVTEENADRLIRGCDAVLDALDNIPSRTMLAKKCAEAGIPLIHGAICGWSAQAAIALPGDGLIEQIYRSGAALKSKASLSFTPPFCAALQTALCVRLLAGREVETGKLYVADLLNMDLETIALLPDRGRPAGERG
ncbi:MAG: HesA/MoeB/ThiF family protein [Oscillospiraceae bacterium]|nr:HesA/MoeB/ThiF family protein [Oscillospiraceae bacterium]